MKKFLKKNEFYFLGSYISFLIFLVCASESLELVGIFFKIIAISMFCLYLFDGNNRNIIGFEKTVLLLFGVALGFLMLVRGKIQGEYAIPNIVCVFIMLIAAVIYFVQNHKGIQLKEWFGENTIILLIIIVFGLLTLEVIDSFFMWDSREYYAKPTSSYDVQGMLYNLDENFADIGGLFLAKHVSLGYSLWLILFQLIKEGSVSVQIADIILAGISIFAYYQILRKILGGKFSNKVLSLATIPYAFSPFVLGMVGYLNLDSTIMYFEVIFIACSLYQYEALECLFAFCLCFTKENAIIYYVGYIVMKVICEYLKNNPFHLRSLIKFGFRNIKNYIYALPVIFWGILRLLNSVWGGDVAWSSEGMNCFGIDINVIEMKLKQIFLLNFNWMFWAVLLVGGIIFVVQRTKINKDVLAYMIPLCSFGIMVIVFGCLYVTWTHARYITPIIPPLYLTATIIIANLGIRQNEFCIWNIIVSVLLFIQCFIVIDPVMSSLFDSLSVGNGELYTMQLNGDERIGTSQVFNDSIVYNRQYMYWQKTLIDMFKKAGYDGNMLVVSPEGVDCTIYALFGFWDPMWDVQKRCLEYYNENVDTPDQCTWIKACQVSDTELNFDNNYILYIIPGWADIDMNFISNKKIIRQGEVCNKGYSIQYMVITIENNLPLADGSYIVSPKQDGMLGLCTEGGDGGKAFLGEDMKPLNLAAINAITYHLNFEGYQVALDVPSASIDSNGTVQVWSINSTNGQKWILEAIDGYYMICFKNYALTYNVDDKSVKLTPKTGEDNQLWSFLY